MRSSATVALRAFIMLACAVGIPVLAMSGASWSEIAKKFQNLRWPAIVQFASASTPSTPPLSEAPPFVPASQADQSQPAEPFPAAAIAGSFDAPAAAPTSAAAARLDPPMTLPGNMAGNSAPVGCEPSAPVPGVPNAASDFGDIPGQLQRLGATYYVLESWGNDQQLYRFYCKMAVTGSADYTHCFEATDANPRQAMQQVLQQVESWRQRTASGG